jgi:N-acetylmuramoyl-L-alanine amidase
MARGAKGILLALMLGWTALTIAAGWYAIGSLQAAPGATNAGPATAQSTGAAGAPTAQVTGAALTQTASPLTRTPAVARTPAGSRTLGPTPTSTAGSGSTTDRPRATPYPYPEPDYAQPAGDGGGAIDSDGRMPASRDAASRPRKGVVVLDPGHGRGDPGAVHYGADGTADVIEAGSNLRNAILIRDELAALGYDVYITRDGPGRGPDGPLAQQFITSDLVWRAQLAAAVDADVFLALHGNGAAVPSISGPETWYCGQNQQASANQRLAAMVQQATMDALREYGYFPPNRGIVEDAERHHSGDFCQFVVTRETVVPSALLEFLFLTNDDDARVLADDRSHQILARYVAVAIDRFLSGE